MIKKLADCSNAELIDPTIHPISNKLSTVYLQKLQRYYLSRLINNDFIGNKFSYC